ncbi:hypothetical protein BDY24DRAFT_388841 [Mrakia frigida]|uniref:uncharacterized protein n=1 Tax=Mrakia frigida TaxID=29902 RepID=UPI003FCC0E10
MGSAEFEKDASLLDAREASSRDFRRESWDDRCQLGRRRRGTDEEATTGRMEDGTETVEDTS